MPVARDTDDQARTVRVGSCMPADVAVSTLADRNGCGGGFSRR